jgi:hypothetical protein
MNRIAAVVGGTAIAVSIATLRAGVPSPAHLVVGPNVRVSGANAAIPHMEVVACADRARPHGRSTLLVASMASRRSRWITVVYRSSDSGNTWTQVMETSGPESFGDPTCAFGTGGRAYYGVLSSLGLAPALRGLQSSATLVYTSQDRGNTWSAHPATQLLVDRPFLTVDNRGEGAPGTVYYAGMAGFESLSGRDPARVDVDDPNIESGIAVFASTDGGKTFASPTFPRYGRNDWPYGIGNSVVTASGEVLTLFRVVKDRFSQPFRTRAEGDVLSVLRTEPGGLMREAPVPIGLVHGNQFPTLALDDTPASRFYNRLYAVARDKRAVVLYWSADEGRTWHGAITVREVPEPPDANLEAVVFNPVVAANRDGTVAVGWAEGSRARTDMVYRRSWSFRMAVSLDGGETFSNAVTVSSGDHIAARVTAIPLFATTTRESAERQRATIIVDPFPDSGGHTFGMAVDSDGVFHPTWTDNRSGVSQVWTASVRVEDK